MHSSMDPAHGSKKDQRQLLLSMGRAWVTVATNLKGNAVCNQDNGRLAMFSRSACIGEKKVFMDHTVSTMLSQVRGVIQPEKTKKGFAQKAIGADVGKSSSEMRVYKSR